MKVKSMKKALSLLCAGAMIATSFAVVNFDTVKAAAHVWNSNTSQSGYPKVPFRNLSAVADSHLTASAESNSTAGAFPGTGNVANIVDGAVTSFYHSNYGSHSGNKVTYANGNLTGNNTVTISFIDEKPQDVMGITYLPRQDALANGAFSKFSVAVQKGADASFETVTTTDLLTYNGNNWNENNETRAEREVLFDTVQEGVTAIKITVTNSAAYNGGSPNEFMSGAEISVLNPVQFEVSGYINGEVRTAPTMNGKLFAGWYSDATYKTPYLETTGKAYAKFVDAKILGSGAQLLATKDSYSDKTNIRFMSTVDSLDYQNVGFVFELEGTNSNVEHISREVYSKLKAMNGSEALSYEPTMFSSKSKYFFAGTLKNVPVAAFDKVITATPFWITKDGTKVLGTPKRISINQADNAQYLNTVKYTTNNSNQITGLADDSDKNWVNLGDATIKSTLTINGAWNEWPRNTDQNKGAFSELGSNNQWILGQKYEIENGDGTASLVYPFEGTGIALYIQKFNSANAGFDVEVLDESGNSIVKTSKQVSATCNNRDDKCFVYSARGLKKGKYQLKLTKCRGKVSVDAVYVVDRVVTETQPQPQQ